MFGNVTLITGVVDIHKMNSILEPNEQCITLAECVPARLNHISVQEEEQV
jgi:hypothetical protein